MIFSSPRPQAAEVTPSSEVSGLMLVLYLGGVESTAGLTGTLFLVAPVVQAVGDQLPVLVEHDLEAQHVDIKHDGGFDVRDEDLRLRRDDNGGSDGGGG